MKEMSKEFEKELWEWVGYDNEPGFKVVSKKYYKGEETLDDLFNRWSGGNPRIKKLIKEKKFLFGGRVNSNRGLNNNASLFNCYSSGFVEDNLQDILEVNTKLGLTYKKQGGQGLSLSKIRPKDTPIGDIETGVSDGIIPFMELFNKTTESISQGGSRKGALLMSLDIRHKEAENFINIKTDLNEINKANLSLEIDNKFMDAVKEYYETGRTQILRENRQYNNQTVTYDIIPIELFKQFVSVAYDYGEPACIFTDRFRNYNLMEKVPSYQIETCNPCIAKGELIQTVEGLIPIEELVDQTPYLYCMNNEGKLTIDKAKKVFLTKKQAEVVKICTPKGDLICTPDHKIMTTNRGWVEAKDLKKGDKIKGLNRAMASEKWLRVGLSGEGYEKEHRFVLRHFQNIENLDVHHKDNNTFNNNLSNLEGLTHSEHSKLSNTGRQIEYNRDPVIGQFLSKVNKKQKECLNQGAKVGVNWFVQKVETLTEPYDVYDIQMENYHNFIAEGFVVHNCGEQPLPKDFCCNLGSINLSAYVKNPYTSEARLDYEALKIDIYTAIDALDELIDENKNNHATIEQSNNSLNYRNIGLGVMGYADMLIKLDYKYGAPDALEFTDGLFRFFFRTAVLASNSLAKQKGTFWNYDERIFDSEIIKNCFNKKEINELLEDGLRNCSLVSIAPTGSISMVCNCSGGIEPLFALEYTRKTEGMGEDTLLVENHLLKEYFDIHIVNPDLTLIQQAPLIFITASEIPWQDRVNTQSIIQEYVDTGISSTVNLDNRTSKDDVEKLFFSAWEQGIKGITIFNNDGKRNGVLVDTSKTKVDIMNTAIAEEKFYPALNEVKPITRNELGQRLEGATYIKKVACGKLYIIINKDKYDNLVEVFIDSGKGGVCAANTECIGRLCSAMLRGGMTVESVIDSIKGIQCGACKQVKGSKSKDIDGNSCGDVIAKTIEEEFLHLKQRTESNMKEACAKAHTRTALKDEPKTEYINNKNKCPDCGEKINFTGGCNVCPNCGYSSCG